MEHFDEVKSLIEQLNENQTASLADMKNRLDGMEALQNRIKLAGGNAPTSAAKPREYVNVAGKLIPILASTEKLGDFAPAAPQDGSKFSLGEYVRANMGIETMNAVVSGPATVPTYVGADIIDAVRAVSTVIRAGAGTISIDGPTNLARITGDPTAYQHTEGAADITESDMTYTAVSANPKALVALVPLSNEIVSDSANLDAVLNVSLASAFASKLDALCLATILADTNIPKSVVAHATATWTGTLLAMAAALNANQNLPTSYIMNAGDFIIRAGLLASTSGSWLGKPPFLSNMQELPTSSIATGLAIFGDFARAFTIAARQNVQLEVVRFGKSTSYSHVLVAHARMDGIVLQPGRLFNQKLVP
ncbi:MAG TPA: phage major capsid protein [Desulfuromonadaceae bacterium]|jgi:HK97 family phage major capsid protein